MKWTRAPEWFWQTAGYPGIDGVESCAGLCWGCCAPTSLGVPVVDMPDTFMDVHGRDAGAPHARHLCAACAWTLSDAIRLPVDVGRPLLVRALDGDGEHPGRVSVATRDEAPARRLVLRLMGGAVGVWERSGRPAEEARWVAARANLSGDPRDMPGCRYLGAYTAAHLSSRVGGKFRNFIAYAGPEGWRMWTKANRAEVRAVVEKPPHTTWALAIGDGQKHAAIYAPLNVPVAGGAPGRVHYMGHAVPAGVSQLLDAMDALLAVGLSRQRLATGNYAGAKLDAATMRAVGRHESILAGYRGSPTFDLYLWLAGPGDQP